MFGFLEIINAIESEIHREYLPGAIRWCDENMSKAWSGAIDRFERSLVNSNEKLDYMQVKHEAQFYKKTILSLLGEYKKGKKIAEVDSFLQAIALTANNPAMTQIELDLSFHTKEKRI